MKFLLAFFSLSVLALAQAFPYGPYSAFTGDFGGPSAFGGAFGPSSAGLVDNRGNRGIGNPGPVTFPMPPTDGPMETSGVVAGASGFGFVPPGGSAANFANFGYGRRRYF